MDVVRVGRRPAFGKFLPYAGFAALALAAAFALPGIFHRTATLPTLDRGSLVFDRVKLGTLVQSVHAAGTLVPDRVQVVATTADGVVEQLSIRPGSFVEAGAPIAVLQNPDLDAAVADARAGLDAALADVRGARQEASAARLDQEAAYRTALAEEKSATAQAVSYRALHAAGLVGDLAYRQATIKADENSSLAGIAQRKIAVAAADSDAKLAAAQARVAQLQAALAAREAQLATLVIRAGSSGIVQSVAVERGQRVASGTELARIAGARDLKAVLQVAESDLRGVDIGMPAAIDADGAAPMRGRVARIAPAAQGGTIAVEVALDAVAAGVRPDQNVDGTIELSRARDALSIARPANAADGGAIVLYRLTPDGSRALRTTVRLGSGSLDRVRVVAGLRAGDTVIVSDTSSYDAPELRIQGSL